MLGGGDWQYKMCNLLENEANKPGAKLHDYYVVIPCRYPRNHPLRDYQSIGTTSEGIFERQTDWERHYLDLAVKVRRGRILFWLGCESKTNPRQDGQPYARDTYGELGEWRGRLIHNVEHRRRVLIGAEAEFPGLSVIQRNFHDALGTAFPFYSSMEMVAHQAALAA